MITRIMRKNYALYPKQSSRPTIPRTKPIAEGGKGLSKRQAAKELGVSHTQIKRDLELNVPKTGTKCSTKIDSAVPGRVILCGLISIPV